ncbi:MULTISPECIES: complex I subunit 1 family protein [Leifsonia]|uniref:NADH-quinone oxidoreductase subunit H n=1 Tax=Leifsonia virtsii TaxID=3035915 RepID=A0ABT8IY03_9MICO|nr:MULTISPECIES: complex I subunit 1 family protein [Leifsonia]MBN9630166.1 NADH-quinone oxidoreductase subunit H [Actinomycetota bacterium]MDN4597683.1 NADH-quinone oxidoreductase subunit H [Leifsonia virtsii]NUU08228.1 NADH-quinone oxidoreductase subunit H [Leifsonia sp. C5G2]
MFEDALWSTLVAVGLLGVFGYAVAATTALMRARQAGSPWTGAWAAPAREVARLLVRQRTAVPGSDRLLARVGGALLPIAAIMALLVLPLDSQPRGPHAISDLSIGVVWFNAMEVLAWVAVWMVGWGSNSAWGVVGANRFLAQGLAYELPHMFALVTVAVGAGSLRVSDIAAAQTGELWFVVVMPVAFIVFLLSVMGFSFWGPFDQAVGRDIAGGVAAQLSGVDRLVFLVGRYLMLTVGSAMAVPLFLGGDAGPVLPGWSWLLVKTVAVLAVLVWVGQRWPTIRMERFTEISWIVLLPAGILQALVVSIFVVVGWM